MARSRVLVCEHLDHTITVHYGNHLLGRYDSAGQPLMLPVQRKPIPTTKRTALLKAAARQEQQTEDRKKNQKTKKRAA